MIFRTLEARSWQVRRSATCAAGLVAALALGGCDAPADPVAPDPAAAALTMRAHLPDSTVQRLLLDLHTVQNPLPPEAWDDLEARARLHLPALLARVEALPDERAVW